MQVGYPCTNPTSGFIGETRRTAGRARHHCTAYTAPQKPALAAASTPSMSSPGLSRAVALRGDATGDAVDDDACEEDSEDEPRVVRRPQDRARARACACGADMLTNVGMSIVPLHRCSAQRVPLEVLGFRARTRLCALTEREGGVGSE